MTGVGAGPGGVSTSRLAGALTLLAALALPPAELSGQLSVGVTGGLVSASLVGGEADALSAKARIGVLGGAWVSIPLSDRLAFEPGVFYMQKGSAFEGTGQGTGKLNLSYLELPLLLAAAITGPTSPVAVSVFGGIAPAIETGCSADATVQGFTVTSNCGPADQDNRQTLDLGAMIGAAIRLPVTQDFSFMLRGGLDFGLRRLDTSSDPVDTKNRTFFGSFASVFPIGG